MSNEYYIYAYLREDSTPYYIGKVKDRRAWSVCRNIKKPADKSKIVKLYAHLTEEQAYDIEIFLIKFLFVILAVIFFHFFTVIFFYFCFYCFTYDLTNRFRLCFFGEKYVFKTSK